jgi:uncharacterized repeat protein (TIGR01451 family)
MEKINKKNKHASFFLIVLLCVSCISSLLLNSFTSYSAELNPNNLKVGVDPIDTSEAPLFVIESDSIPTAKAAQYLSFNLKIKNNGNGNANNVQVVFSIPSGTPFENTSLVNSKLFPLFDKDTIQTVTLGYRIKSSAKVGVYPIDVKFVYFNAAGSRLESTDTIFIRVIENTESISVDVVNSYTLPSIPTIGTNFSLSIEIGNNSTRQINNVEVTLDGLSKDSFTAVELNKKNTGILVAGQRKNVDFRLLSSNKLDEGGQSIPVKIKYSDASGETVEESRTVFVQLRKEDYALLKLKNIVYPSSKVAMGRNFEVSFDLENMTNRVVENVNISIDPGDKIIPITTINQKVVNFKVSEKKSFNFVLQPLEKIDPKPYVIAIEVKYPVSSGSKEFETYRETFTIEVVRGSDLQLTDVSFPYTIAENKDFTFNFNLSNTGLGVAKNVKVSLELKSGLIVSSSSFISLQDLESKSSKPVSFNLRSTKVTEQGTYPLVIKVTSDSSSEVLSYNFNVYIEKEDIKKSVPRIILERYQINPERVQPGGKFDLDLNLLNTSTTKAISNIKVSINSDELSEKNVSQGSVFSPVKASNTFFINKLAPNQRLAKTLQYQVKTNVDAKNYNLNILIEYEDNEGNPLNVKETVNVPIEIKAEYYKTDLFIPPDIFANNPYALSIRFFNTGKVPIKNFQIKPEGDFLIDTLPYFAVNIGVGSDDTYEFTITPQKVGKLFGKLLISYEETNGEIKESTMDFSIDVAEMPTIDPLLTDPNQTMDSSQSSLLSTLNIILFVGICSLIAMIWYFRARRKKRISNYEVD